MLAATSPGSPGRGGSALSAPHLLSRAARPNWKEASFHVRSVETDNNRDGVAHLKLVNAIRRSWCWQYITIVLNIIVPGQHMSVVSRLPSAFIAGQLAPSCGSFKITERRGGIRKGVTRDSKMGLSCKGDLARPWRIKQGRHEGISTIVDEQTRL